MPRTAEIIAVGSELLTGGVTNTNAAFLSRLLTAAGVEVLYHTTVDDDAARLEKAVTIARGRAELLVFTGGLGPTYDDMTKTAVCAALDTPLVFHPEVVEDMRRYFDRVFRREMPECDMQQAYLPAGCTVFRWARPQGACSPPERPRQRCCPVCPMSAAIWPSTACCPGWSRSGDRRCGHTRCISSA